MGFGFRKSFKLGKHTRLNLNKRGASISFGGKHVRHTVNTNGRRSTTARIPGTGLSYRKSSKRKKR